MEPRFDSSLVRRTFGGAVFGLAVMIGGACAEGTDADPGGAASPGPDAAPDTTTAGGCREICPPNQTCSNGRCVVSGIDADGDGSFSKEDCDDDDPKVYPGALETCNQKDDDCNGVVDDVADEDGDGYFLCKQGSAPVDCDDKDPAINPKAVEVCNGKDDDCNGKIDELPATLSEPVSGMRWKTVGDATIASDWAQLTTDAIDKVGGLFWDATYSFDSFDMTASFKIQNKAEVADGFAFVWLQGTNLVTGGGGNNIGAGNLTGYGVAIDTWNNSQEASNPAVVLLNTKTGQRIKEVALPKTLLDGNEHTLRVVLTGGKVSAFVDGTARLPATAISGYAPFDGHWGFTSATGSTSGAHSVGKITMKFPDGQGCVP